MNETRTRLTGNIGIIVARRESEDIVRYYCWNQTTENDRGKKYGREEGEATITCAKPSTSVVLMVKTPYTAGYRHS